MEITKEAMDQLSAVLGESKTRMDGIETKVDGIPEAIRKAFEEKDTAKLEREGALEGLSKMEVWDIPLGQALVGGFTAVFFSEIIDGILAAQSPMTLGFIKLVGAGVAVKWGARVFGSTGSKALAIILAYDGLRQILPIDEWAGRLSGGITTRVGGGLAGKAGMGRGSVIKQAEKVASDYYAVAEGRR